MTNIQTLIEQTLAAATERAESNDKDLATVYYEDMTSFIEIKYLIEAGYTAAASKELNEMDTHPCEQFVMAMVADGYDIKKYGFKLL